MSDKNIIFDSCKLLVSNLDFGVSEQDIHDLFSDFDNLRSVTLHCDNIGKSLGTAEVFFDRTSDAIKAMKEYNDMPLDGKKLMIEILVSDKMTGTSQLLRRQRSTVGMVRGPMFEIGRCQAPMQRRKRIRSGTKGGWGEITGSETKMTVTSQPLKRRRGTGGQMKDMERSKVPTPWRSTIPFGAKGGRSEITGAEKRKTFTSQPLRRRRGTGGQMEDMGRSQGPTASRNMIRGGANGRWGGSRKETQSVLRKEDLDAEMDAYMGAMTA